MAQDPYGYGESGRVTTGGDASQAMWLGVSAVAVTAAAPCLLSLPHVVAFPLGGYAFWRAYQAAQVLPPGDAAGRSMTTAGMISGAVAFLVSGLFCLFFALYVGLIALAVFIPLVVGGLSGLGGN